jgi:hypothetical protein
MEVMLIGNQFPMCQLHPGSVPNNEVEGLVGIVFRCIVDELNMLFLGGGVAVVISSNSADVQEWSTVQEHGKQLEGDISGGSKHLTKVAGSMRMIPCQCATAA